MTSNPYRIPNKPAVTIREILVWIRGQGDITLHDVVDTFGITKGDASVRLLKLHRWGYVRRKKADVPPRIFHYTVSKFGRKTAKKWA